MTCEKKRLAAAAALWREVVSYETDTLPTVQQAPRRLYHKEQDVTVKSRRVHLGFVMDGLGWL